MLVPKESFVPMKIKDKLKFIKSLVLDSIKKKIGNL